MRRSRGNAGFLSNPWLTAGLSAVAIGFLAFLLLWNPRSQESAGDDRPVILYCAAGMRLPVNAIIARYEAETGKTVVPEYGGSGELLATLRVEGDSPRADLFLAADDSYIQDARRLDLVVESLPVARMKPVLAVHRGNPREVRTLEDLRRQDVKVVLANPEFAAVGRVARRLLEQMQLWQPLQAESRELRARVSMVGRVTEVANNLHIGTADVGIVWDATVKQYPDLRALPIELPDDGIQDVTVAVVKGTPRPTAALRFARFLTARDRGLQSFASMGWEPVDGDLWVERPQLVLYSGGVNRPAVEKTLEEFQKREGVDITVKFHGCGILVSDMRAIAQGDVPTAFPDAYFACDASFIPPVEEHFLPPAVISETKIVLLVRKGNPKSLKKLADLTKPGLRICMANEEHSALGALTRRLLQTAGIYDAVKKNVVFQSPSADPLVLRMEANAAGGGEDVAIVYAANCSEISSGLEIVPLADEKAKAVQPFVVARSSDHRYLVERLRSALMSSTSRQRFEAVGFQWRAGDQ